MIHYQRDWYRSRAIRRRSGRRPIPRACAATAPGRKTVVWYAEEVPDFGMAMSPDFRYEEGDFFERPVRVLYRSGGRRPWGAGLVTGWTESAIAWLDRGARAAHPWPQTTVVEGLDAPGEGTPMLSHRGARAAARSCGCWGTPGWPR